MLICGHNPGSTLPRLPQLLVCANVSPDGNVDALAHAAPTNADLAGWPRCASYTLANLHAKRRISAWWTQDARGSEDAVGVLLERLRAVCVRKNLHRKMHAIDARRARGCRDADAEAAFLRGRARVSQGLDPPADDYGLGEHEEHERPEERLEAVFVGARGAPVVPRVLSERNGWVPHAGWRR